MGVGMQRENEMMGAILLMTPCIRPEPFPA
ncbi:MAG: hypothetical protein RLZZ268_995 [Cyanobacteriota bacterium]|jgi:hypothetical protein